MRLRVCAAAGGWFAFSVLFAAGCSAGPPAPRGTVAACRTYGVRAIEARSTVRRVPAACAGLTATQVNEAAESAIRETVGPLPKAAARRLAVTNGRYLAPLIRAVRPPSPQLPLAAAAERASILPVAVAGLICWLATAGVGVFLLVSSGMMASLRKRTARRRSQRPTVVLAHAAFAIAGLAVWIAFASTSVAALAWVAVGIIMAVVGLGMSTLVAGLPDSGLGQPARPRATRLRLAAPVIAIHGILATVTIVVAILGAIAAS